MIPSDGGEGGWRRGSPFPTMGHVVTSPDRLLSDLGRSVLTYCSLWVESRRGLKYRFSRNISNGRLKYYIKTLVICVVLHHLVS